jgi:hypothetical protein
MKNLRECECDDRESLMSETAKKGMPLNQQLFCFSRDFDSKSGAGVCQMASGFSFLDDFREFLPVGNPSAQKWHLDSRQEQSCCH